jgi:hypothetical protein
LQRGPDQLGLARRIWPTQFGPVTGPIPHGRVVMKSTECDRVEEKPPNGPVVPDRYSKQKITLEHKEQERISMQD